MKKKKAMKKQKKKAMKKAVGDLADLAVTDPITPYLSWDGASPTKYIMLKRVHSKVWHLTRNKMLKGGASDDDAKARAGKDGEAAKQRFLRAMGMPS